MKRLLVLSVLLLAAPAVAQQPTAQEQIATTIGTLVIQNATLTEQARRLQERVAQLERELAAIKPSAER